MRQVTSCGTIVFRRQPSPAFLLLKHSDRVDLPKGHRQAGETDLACALRELAEETGLTAEDVQVDPSFRFESKYYPRYRRFGGQTVEKTVVLFLAFLVNDRPLVLGEHQDHVWTPWQPPHHFGVSTIDGVLAELERYLPSLG